MDILALLLCLHPCLTTTTLHQLSRIALALLTMTGRVTMTGIARWGGHGTSYRTVQRFFASTIPWPQLFWLLFHHHLFDPDDVYLLAGDEVVVTKAGKKTFGLDRFFSGIYQKVVPSVAFFSLALISTKTRRAVPLRLEQIVRTETEKAASKAKAAKKAKAKTAREGSAKRKGRAEGMAKSASLRVGSQKRTAKR